MKKQKTAAEFLAELAADEEFVRKQRARDEELRQQEESLAIAEAPLVEALREVGLDVLSVWDMVNSAKAYPEAIAVLFEHLQKPYPERIIEGIIRALAVPDSSSRWSELLRIFENAPPQAVGGIRWAAACALGAAADDRNIDEVLRIVGDNHNGFDRAALLPALARSDDARAKMLLHKLRDDAVLGREVKKLRRLNRNKGA